RSELHSPFCSRKNRVIATEAGPLTGPEPGAPLAHDDLAAGHLLAGEDLDPEHLRVGVAAIAAGAEAFLMSHLRPPFSRLWVSPRLFSRRRPSSARSPRAWSARSGGRRGGGSPSSACI